MLALEPESYFCQESVGDDEDVTFLSCSHVDLTTERSSLGPFFGHVRQKFQIFDFSLSSFVLDVRALSS